MQIKNKFIEGASGATKTGVTDDKIRLQSAGYLKSRNAANSADVNMFRLNGSDVLEFPSVPQIAAGTPTNPSDVATMQSITNAINGVQSMKNSVRALSSTNVTIPPGGTTFTVDGVALANGDRVALVGQTTGSQNGIYVVAGVGTAVTLSRAADWTSSGQVVEGTAFLVDEGTVAAKSQWMVTNTGAIVIGTTAVTLVKFQQQVAYTAGDMLSLTGTQFAVALNTTSGLVSSSPGNPGGLLSVNPASNTLKLNGSNQVEGLKSIIDSFTLIAGDITNQFVDLTQVAENANSIKLVCIGGPEQTNGTDYTINLTGGTGGKTRLTFAGDLATAGAAALVAGDILKVQYRYL